MKREHRHELKTNELEKLMERVKPFFHQYGFAIVMGLCGLALVAAVALFWGRRTSAGNTAGWTELYEAESAEDFLAVAEKQEYADTPVVDWARLRAAEDYLRSGIQQSLEHREGEKGLVSDLDEARENFEEVLQAAPQGSTLRERALFGLARTLETMAGVNQAEDGPTADELLADAIDAYETLVEEYPETPYNRKDTNDAPRGDIEERIERLKSRSAEQFYAWFRTRNPKPEQRRGGPRDGLPADHPPLGGGSGASESLPSIPERLRLPEGEGDDAGGASEGETPAPNSGDSEGETPSAAPEPDSGPAGNPPGSDDSPPSKKSSEQQ